MIYPSELVTKNLMVGKSVGLRREIKFYEEFFGCDPRHIGGEYDIAFALKICQFAKAYHRSRIRCFKLVLLRWKRKLQGRR